MDVKLASPAHETADRVARESYGRLVAYLSARSRDIAGAEDALAAAFAAALEHWPVSGVPDNPDAWLLTTARRKQTDEHRKSITRTSHQTELQMITEELKEADEHSEIPDRRLALMFACAHPAIDPGMRTPLILQTILGLNAAEIASAFLVPPGTMGQRLVRAKAKIKIAGIGFSVPEREQLSFRVSAVLDAVYAIYSRGWSETSETGTPALANEAIWLGHLLVQLLPEEPEAKGMLSLMLFAEARRPARHDAKGDYVPLEAQDTALWDHKMCTTAEHLLHNANQSGPSGPYQIEAAIQSAHAARLLRGQDTWLAIVQLYDHLQTLTDSPVVLLNRAVASSNVEGPKQALMSIEALGSDQRMKTFQPYWAALGHLYTQAGRRAEAREALTVAVGLSTDEAQRRFLLRQRGVLHDG